MKPISEIKRFLGEHRHQLTPKQALDLDEKVVESWDPKHPEAPPSVDFSDMTDEQKMGEYLFKDPDWIGRSDGADPSAKPLYPADNTHDSPTESSMSEGKA